MQYLTQIITPSNCMDMLWRTFCLRQYLSGVFCHSTYCYVRQLSENVSSIAYQYNCELRHYFLYRQNNWHLPQNKLQFTKTRFSKLCFSKLQSLYYQKKEVMVCLLEDRMNCLSLTGFIIPVNLSLRLFTWNFK